MPAEQDLFFVIKLDFSFSTTAEDVITAFRIKAHVNNKLHSRVPSLLVLTNRRLIIYRTSPIRAYWVRLVLVKTIELIPVIGWVVSFIVNKMAEGFDAIYRKITRTKNRENELLAKMTRNDLITNAQGWPVTFQKELPVLADELKCVRIRSVWPRMILPETKSSLKSFRYPYIKFLSADHSLLLSIQVKLSDKELSRWVKVVMENDEIILTPQ